MATKKAIKNAVMKEQKEQPCIDYKTAKVFVKMYNFIIHENKTRKYLYEELQRMELMIKMMKTDYAQRPDLEVWRSISSGFFTDKLFNKLSDKEFKERFIGLRGDPVLEHEIDDRYVKKIQAMEGTPLPDNITDLRSVLRRDGLILFSWIEMKTTPKTYTIFWLSKKGKRKVYTVESVTEDTLNFVMPDKETSKWDAMDVDILASSDEISEIEHFVYVAPVEILDSPATPDLRIEYIQKLEAMGIDTGSDNIFRMSDQPVTKKAV